MPKDGVTKIFIKGFHPLDITLPDADTLEGTVRIVLPEVHVQLLDLSMGIDLLKGAHIGGDAPMVGVDMDLSSPMDIGKLVMFITKSAGTLEKIWQTSQQELDKKGALLG